MSKKKPIVCNVISLFYPVEGGDENTIKLLSENLINEYGYEVKVLTRRRGGILNNWDLKPKENVDGIEVNRISVKTGRFGSLFFIFYGIIHLITTKKSKIYQACDLVVSSWIVTIVKIFTGAYTVIKLRSGIFKYEKLLSSYFRLSKLLSYYWIMIPLKLADRIIVNNHEVKQFLYMQGIEKSKIRRIPNAIDTALFTNINRKKKLNSKNNLKLPVDVPIFLYAGRFRSIKGVQVLLKAWSIFKQDFPNPAILVLIGQSGDIDVSKMVKELKLIDSIIIENFVDSVIPYYQASDVFILPSYTEGISLSLLEAMSMKLPVIASSVGGAIDIINDGVNGFLFESGNSLMLSEKIYKILLLKDKWESIGFEAHKSVMSYADIKIVSKKTNELYQELF